MVAIESLVRVEADEVLSHTEWQSVVVQGRYKEFRDTPEHLEERLQVQARLEQVDQLWWDRGFAAAQASRHFDLDMTVFYCIHIQEITGRCASSDPVEQR
ncbi:MAG: pyridoxamine 5'-phosphate oxidase family protein [Candidatus Korobacteraceae bacterium]